jgi:hypothetical protein
VKTALLVAALVVCGGAKALAQGSVVFSNSGGQPVISCIDGSRIPVGSTYQAELVYAPDGTLEADYYFMAVRLGGAANFGPTPGFFAGGARTVASIQPAGGFGLFQVRVWTSAHGTSYKDIVDRAVIGSQLGKSTILRVDTANPVIGEAPVSLVAAGLGQIGVNWGEFAGEPCIPEPSTWAIGVMATGALLVALRKRSART